MIILPIWLWLAIFAIAAAAGGIAWLRKTLITYPESARAVAERRAISDARLENHCRLLVTQREITAPGQTLFVASLEPIEFTSGTSCARTPISMILSERTMAIAHKQGALGNIAAILVSRSDIQSVIPGEEPHGPACTIKTRKHGLFTFQFQSAEDRDQLASWITTTATDRL